MVEIGDRQTHQTVIDMFIKRLTVLREKLTVRHPTPYFLQAIYDGLLLQSEAVKGKVSLTCDAWQGSNMDGCLAVTGSWVEEDRWVWRIQTALLGFMSLDNVYNGTRLGQALFEIVSRVGIVHKASVVHVSGFHAL